MSSWVSIKQAPRDAAPCPPRPAAGDTIKTLNSSKITGPNSTPTKTIKTVQDDILIPLSNLIN